MLVAVGRHADTNSIGLDNNELVEAKLSNSKKIIVDQFCKVQGVGCDSI